MHLANWFSNYHIIKILEIVCRNMNCFLWVKLISVLIHLKYLYCNTSCLERLCLPRHLSWNLPCPSEIPLQRNPYLVLHQFSYLVLPHSTTHYNYWMYQTICQDKPIKSIIKLCTNHNTLFVKHVTYRKTEPLRVVSLSKLDNTVSNSSVFNTKCAECSLKW